MTATPTPHTPDEEVAQNIFSRFRDTALLPPLLLTPALLAQLAEGSLRAEDWRLLAEKAQELAHRGATSK
ncbi:MAG: hypothetical protein KA314_29165 [Chloroflexi bacterium]|nr:hypothetical protein [Chloroflexota bacterium]MBP8059929.1 hypothetical protein [Chloroflexota bacterium]